MIIVRPLSVWIATIVAVLVPARAMTDGNLIPMLLGFFFTIPAMMFLVTLHFLEGRLLRSTLPAMSLALGPILMVLGGLAKAGPIAELAWPMGLVWLLTGLLRALAYRPAPSWP